MATQLLIHHQTPVTRLTLNRPERRNALSLALMRDLLAALRALPETTHAVILDSSGPVFSSGHDLGEMTGRALTGYREIFDTCTELMTTLQTIRQPVIAAVQGLATAAGCQLVASCDLAIAAQSARFGVSGINVGLFCSTPAVALTRNVPTKQAFDMLVTGDLINAQAALERGLVSEVVEDEALDAAVARKAQAILAKSPTAIRYGKAMFHAQRRMPLDEAYDFASDVMARNMMEPDTLEGVLAFIEKRPPVRQG